MEFKFAKTKLAELEFQKTHRVSRRTNFTNSFFKLWKNMIAFKLSASSKFKASGLKKQIRSHF